MHSVAFITRIHRLLKYQLFILAIAIIVLFITLKISPESNLFLKFGNMNEIALKENWLGINGKSTWKKNGFQLFFLLVFLQPYICF